jgi:high-affinity Fe2+/Pb2+ permease
MSPHLIGTTLIILGILFILAGFVGGIARMFRRAAEKARNGKPVEERDLPTKFIETLIAFLAALLKAPVWLAMVFIGLFLAGWGVTML